MSDVLVVALVGAGTSEDLRRTTEALEDHTPGLQDGRVRVLAPASPTEQVADRSIWDALRAVPEADLVLLEVGLAVGPAWHETLRAAAYEDGVIATASAVPSQVLGRDGPVAAAEPERHGTSLGKPVWGCVYVRRDALNVALSMRWPPPADGPAGGDASLESVLLVPGLVHVLAKSVVAGHGASPGGMFATPPVRRALAQLEAEVEPLSVAIDLRCCSYPLSGTQVHALNLVAALARDESLRLSVRLPSAVHESCRSHVDALPASVARRTDGDPEETPPHVFHRPYQLLSDSEIADVVLQASRLVVTHQDLILDRTPAYFPGERDWYGYASATALSFVAADEVAFFSEHARQEAIRDGLVDAAKTSVVAPGTDHAEAGAGGETRPAAMSALHVDDPFILVLGNAYFHKNRVFALRVADELRRQHDWNGALVFVGGRPGDGSSATDEARFLSDHAELYARFVEIGRVTDDEQRWLYRHAALVLYPSLYEGFGLIPFEAAAASTPSLYPSRSSVAEFLPAEGALVDLTDAVITADRAAEVLHSADRATEIVRSIQAAGKTLTWDRAAASYARIYRRAIERPVGLALAMRGDVVVGGRSEVAADETERNVLFVLRRFGVARLLAKALLGAAAALYRLLRR